MFENHYKCRCGSHVMIPAMKKGSSGVSYRSCLACGTVYRPVSQFDKKRKRASIKEAERSKRFWRDCFEKGTITSDELQKHLECSDEIIALANKPPADPREFPAVKAGVEVVGDAEREEADFNHPPEYVLWDLLRDEIDIESLQVLIAKAKAWDEVSDMEDPRIDMARVLAEMPLTHCDSLLSEIKANADSRAARLKAFFAFSEEDRAEK